MSNVLRDKKGRFIPQNNSNCVPVPAAWLRRLAEVSRKVSSIKDDVNYLKGYCESAESFLLSKDILEEKK